MRGYDKIAEHSGILLDFPFYEGVGAITRDQAKPHHQDADLISTPTWEAIISGLGVLSFNGVNEYLELDDAACADLDFVAGDYSLACWFKWTNNFVSQILMGRYQLDVSGWELYLYGGGGIDYLTLRHHHAATLVPPVTGNPRSACYTDGWASDTWWLMGISRSGTSALHYRNGESLDTVCSTGGLIAPETCARDWVAGARFTKDDNFYKGKMWRPRIWGRALAASEWLRLFNAERDWFGV